MKILIVEDSLEIIEALRCTIRLKWSQATVISTTMGQTGVELARNDRPDVIFLDLGLPDITGFEVLHKIRAFSDVPVILLTVKGEEIYKIQGFEMGADDYIMKPFSPGELLARVKALLRRRGILQESDDSGGEPFIRGRLSIDFISNEFRVGDKQLDLSPTMIEILHVLVDNKNKVVSRQELLEKIGGQEEKAYVDACVKLLKKTLEKELNHPILIVQEDGESYKFIG